MQIVGERLDDDALGRRQRAEFDEVLLVDEPRAGAKPVTTKIVADLRIADAMHLMRLVEETVTLARVGPIRLRVISRAWVGSATASPMVTFNPPRRSRCCRRCRMIELQPHDAGVAVTAELGAANGAARFADERGEIDGRR